MGGSIAKLLLDRRLHLSPDPSSISTAALRGRTGKAGFSAGEGFRQANELQVIKLRQGSPRQSSTLDLRLPPAAALRLAQSAAEMSVVHLFAAV